MSTHVHDDEVARRFRDLLGEESVFHHEDLSIRLHELLDDDMTKRFDVASENLGQETTGGVVSNDELTFNKLWELSMRLDAKQAAETLSVSMTKFKTICRDKGIRWWPYRKLKSYRALLRSTKTTESEKTYIRNVMASSPFHRFSNIEDDLWTARRRMYKKTQRIKTQRARRATDHRAPHSFVTDRTQEVPVHALKSMTVGDLGPNGP